MNLKRLLGLDIARETVCLRQRSGDLATSPRKRVPTAGSRRPAAIARSGCGMLHRRQGRPSAVASRGNPDHPVNRGKLCPKGLVGAPHDRRGEPRALSAAASKDGKLERVSAGTKRSRTMVDEFRARAGAARAAGASASSAPASWSPKSSTRWASWCSSASARRNYDGNTTLCMSTAVAGYKRSFGSDGPPGRLRGPRARRRDSADRREHRRQPSDPLPAPRGESATRR